MLGTRWPDVRSYLELVRIPAVFTAPADVLAGLALAAAWGHPVRLVEILCLVLAGALIYCAGMAANDIFDRRIDAVERPGRPIPSGRVSLGAAWAFVLLAQGLGLGLAALLNLEAVAAVGVTIVATYLYNGLLKASLLGPFIMALCRYGNALIGLSVLGWAALDGYLLIIPTTTALFVLMLTTVSRFEVSGGQSASSRWALMGFVTAAGLCGVWSGLGILPVRWAAFLGVLPILWLYRPARAAWTVGGGGDFRATVMAGIFGIALVNAIIAVGAGQWLFGLAICASAGVGKVFARWFYAT